MINVSQHYTQPRIVFEALLVKASELKTESSYEALVTRVNELEKMLRRSALNGGIINYSAPERKEVSRAKIEETLSKFSTKSSEAPVFEEAPEVKKVDERAKMLMGLLITGLRESDNMMLYSALNRQNNYELQDKVLTVYITDNASLSLFDNSDNVSACEKVLRDSTDDQEYTVRIVNGNASNRKLSDDQRRKLSDVFQNKLIDRNIKK